MKFTKDEIRQGMTLYAVTDRSWLGERTLAQVVEEVLKGGATFLQLREKELDQATILAEAREIQAIAARYHVPFVINDSVDIALVCDADGVHVGQADLMGRDVRALIGPDKILGITANTVELAVAAEQAGADYIGAGAVFGTTTKQNAKNLSLDTLKAICQAVSIPVVGMGGIMTGEDAVAFMLCGARAVMVGTANVSNPNACPEIIKGIEEYMIRHDIRDVNELVDALMV